MAKIYDYEMIIRFFITGEMRFMDPTGLGVLFPTRICVVGGTKKTRKEAELFGIMTNFGEIGQFSSLTARGISGNVPHFVIRGFLNTVFEN